MKMFERSSPKHSVCFEMKIDQQPDALRFSAKTESETKLILLVSLFQRHLFKIYLKGPVKVLKSRQLKRRHNLHKK